MIATRNIPADELRVRLRRFRRAYAEHRAREGRGPAEELADLPYIAKGRLAAQWRVRARTFDGFVARVLQPLARDVGRSLTVLDLGAGNGWLCYRMSRLGHRAIAVDFRTDTVDGLGAGRGYCAYLPTLFPRLGASFEALPLPARCADLAVFNASLHYATDLRVALREAARAVGPSGRVAVLDSPFYQTIAAGEAMIREKERDAIRSWGDLAHDLSTLPFVEYLTRERLVAASDGCITWRRHRVRYPLTYELRPLMALLRGARRPSRFDVWEGRVAPARCG